MKSIYRLILSVILTAIAIGVLKLSCSATGTEHADCEPTILSILFAAILLASFISPLIRVKAKKVTSGKKPKKAKQAKKSSPGGNRESGTVKWFNVSKGYGFVTRENGEEIFVHFRSIRGEGRRVLREGDSIEFTVSQGDKGPQAEDVESLG
jgi:cold shock protein